jgi:class 3 adenylate cyclase
MAHTWDHDQAKDHIDAKIAEVEHVEIVDYKKDMSLDNIPVQKAYRVNGSHLYVDILNLGDMLNVTDSEGEICHKRTLRFLNLHYRAVHRILNSCDVKRVDFHNQRLHSVVIKPYDSEDNAEASRVHRAVAVGQLIIDVLAETGDDDENIPNAKARIGIDCGEALAVNNGRRGSREPLFLGDAANQAAKLSGGGQSKGIFLSNRARSSIGLANVDSPKNTPLTSDDIKRSQDIACLEVNKDTIIKEWRADLETSPIGTFSFSRHTPPLRTLDITSLTPSNSRRQEAISMYADIDAFTAYVDQNIASAAEDVARTFHVIRAELDRVLTSDFDGRRIRFVGDCIHGLICEGTAHTTDIQETITTATLCAGAIRSSFELCLERLNASGINTDDLGIAVGFEYGPMTVSRLGMQGDRVRCSVSRGVLASEQQQQRCDGTQTAIGSSAYGESTEAVRELFGTKRIVSNLDYNEAVDALSPKDKTAADSKKAAYGSSATIVERSSNLEIRPHSK